MVKPDTTYRNAHLILAHEDAEMLNTLAQRLAKTGFVYIHLDRLSKIQVSQVLQHPKVKITKEIKVNWGGYSIIQATQLLADQAIADGSTRLTLLSGLSYPIVSDEKLIQFAKSEDEYVDAVEVDFTKINKTFTRRFTTGHFSFHLKLNIFGRVIRRISREFWYRMPHVYPTEVLSPIKLTFGSQWWSKKSQTYSDSAKLVRSNPDIEKYFKKIECSDESFFGTIFHEVSPGHISQGTTFVKWGIRGIPQPLSLDDFRIERTLGRFLFIRKVRSEDYKILNTFLN